MVASKISDNYNFVYINIGKEDSICLHNNQGQKSISNPNIGVINWYRQEMIKEGFLLLDRASFNDNEVTETYVYEVES